ncbi:MAG: alanine racemase [Acidobacteria bacterium]|nr:MAG: alanine racemase [Acidobacteriota bacterium]
MIKLPADGGGLPTALRPAWAVVDLDALEHNLAFVRRQVEPAGLLAVIKADAYGHGAPIVARTLESAGIDWLGVALAEEGVELRREGLTTPILVVGTCQPGQLALYQRYDLTPTISSRDQLDLWTAWSGLGGTPQAIHVKVDVGMNRLGIAPPELPTALEEIRAHPGLELAGLLSHLAEADDLESPRTAEQEKRFAEVLDHLREDERGKVQVHLANSAAALHHPDTRHTFVRTGLTLFGIDPAGVETGLEPVMSVHSRVVQVKEVPAGARPGYGGTWTAPRDSRLGVVPVGYADGYSWRLSNRAEMLIGGTRVPVVGAVSMDMTLIDLTDTDAGLGEEVVLLGRQGDEVLAAREVAAWSDTIVYEVLCLLGLRLPRRYRRAGRDVAFDSRFTH